MEFNELAKNRWSCRAFSDREVPHALLEQIVRTGLLAPTAKNLQPYRVFAMTSPSAVENMRKASPCTYGAKNFLVVGYREDQAWVRSFDNRNFGCVDAAIVATHLMLEITALGLSTTWVGHFDAPMLKKLYPQMAEYELIAVFPIGYADGEARPSDRHEQRNALDQMLVEL